MNRKAIAQGMSFLLVSLAVILPARAGRAAEFETLGALKGFYVSVVENIGLPKATPETLSKMEGEASANMQRLVQDELRKAGIEVFTQEQFRDQADVPSLMVSETTFIDEFGTKHAAIRLEVRQLVGIFANRQNALATTWSRDRLVVIGKDAVKERGSAPIVHGMVEELVTDYLRANPSASRSGE